MRHCKIFRIKARERKKENERERRKENLERYTDFQTQTIREKKRERGKKGREKKNLELLVALWSV